MKLFPSRAALQIQQIIFSNVDHTYPFLTEETGGTDNEISQVDEVQNQELVDSDAGEDYRPGFHDNEDPSDDDRSSYDSDSQGALKIVTAEDPNPLYVAHEEVETTASKRKTRKGKHNWYKNQSKRLRIMSNETRDKKDQ